MKKLIAITLAAVLGLSILSGCGEEKPVPTPTPPPTPEVVETTPPPEPVAAIPEFTMTKEGTIESLNKDFEQVGFAALVGDKGESTESELMGKNTAYEYSIGTGASLILYESDVTKNVISIFMLTDKNKADNDTMKKSGFLTALLVGGLTANDTEMEDIETELQLDSTKDGTSTFAQGEYADFSYSVNDGNIMLLISPVALSTEKNTQQTEVDLSALSAAIVEEFSGAFGYPGNETSWYKYVQSITVTEVDGIYSAVVIVSTTDAEPVDRIGNAVYANYCLNDFKGIDIDSCFVFDEEMNTLFIRADEV